MVDMARHLVKHYQTFLYLTCIYIITKQFFMSFFEKLLTTDGARSTIVIRVLVGVVFLSEGIQKFLYPEQCGAGRFKDIGLPEPELLGYMIGGFEVICGILVLIGLSTRFASFILICIMLVAIASTKIPILMDEGFWQMMHDIRNDWSMLLGSIFLLIKGGGKYSLDHQLFKRKSYYKRSKRL